jgi:predicted RNA binding protein YcfA (HicA-like mRNA interferase family)
MQCRALVRHMKKHGCTLLREDKRHSIYHNPAKDKTSAVPRHTEIGDILARKICQDLEILAP